MSFYNFETKDEQIFKDQRPELYKFFQDELARLCLNKNVSVDSFRFNQVLGYDSPIGQCYEVSYGNPYAYGMTAYLECHLQDSEFITDNFNLGNT